jgi:hypothetical protein
MRRWKELTVAGLACVLFVAALTQLVVAQRPAQLRAETKAMAQRVEQIQVRVQLITDDIGRQSNANASYYRHLKKMNESVVRLSGEMQAAYETAQELLKDDVIAGDPALQQDVIAMRKQLECVARDIENVLQYMEHASFLLDRKSLNS